MAENIRQAILDYRFSWEQTTSSIGASIGVVEITSETESVANLLSAADIACYAAKDSGRNRVHLYDSNEVSGRHREMYWVSRVTRAVDEGRLELLLPADRRRPAARPRRACRVCELLVRLRDDDGELVMPERVHSGRRALQPGRPAIDRWVMQRAVEALREHASGDEPPFLFALNLSGMSLSDRGFLEFRAVLVEDRASRAGCASRSPRPRSSPA